MCRNLCRVCGKNVSEKDATKLFDNQNQKLLIQIKDLTGVKLKNGLGLPKIICCKCKLDLYDAYKFRVNFLKVQESFKVRSSKGSKKQTDSLVEATEFVQLLVVKEEKNITTNDNKEIYGVNEEEEININENIKTNVLDKKQNLAFIKYDGDEINALELKPNEENTLGDTKITIEEVSYNNSYEDYISLKSFSDDEELTNKESDDDYRPTNKRTVKANKSKVNSKIQDTDVVPRDWENIDFKGKTQSKKKRKDDEQSNIFICDQCGNHFTCRHHFKLHLRRHTGDKRCACELCPDKFFTSSELRRHMRRHTGERPFACKYCDRRFTDYSTRIKHERTHTNERPFMCSQCGKSFTTSYILKNHMLTHTGERHFKCDVCKKAFTRRTHLVVHYRSIMHKQAVEKDNRPNLQDELQQTNSLISQSKHAPNFLV